MSLLQQRQQAILAKKSTLPIQGFQLNQGGSPLSVITFNKEPHDLPETGEDKKEYVFSPTYIPDSACQVERGIHDYLTKMGIFMVDLKETIDSQTRVECRSP